MCECVCVCVNVHVCVVHVGALTNACMWRPEVKCLSLSPPPYLLRASCFLNLEQHWLASVPQGSSSLCAPVLGLLMSTYHFAGGGGSGFSRQVSLSSPGCLRTRPVVQGASNWRSTRLCLLMWITDMRHLHLACLFFNASAGYLNSGPHAYLASTIPIKRNAVPSLFNRQYNIFFYFFWSSETGFLCVVMKQTL